MGVLFCTLFRNTGFVDTGYLNFEWMERVRWGIVRVICTLSGFHISTSTVERLSIRGMLRITLLVKKFTSR